MLFIEAMRRNKMGLPHIMREPAESTGVYVEQGYQLMGMLISES